MYLIYVDESGDTGLINSPTNFFVLSAIVIHESAWMNVLDDLINFRRYLKIRYGIMMKEEIHASEFVNGKNKLRNPIAKHDRIDLLKKCLKWLNSRNDVSIITVRCDKSAVTNNTVFEKNLEGSTPKS